MEPRRRLRLFALSFLFLFLSCSGEVQHNVFVGLLSSIVRNSAFEAIIRRRSNVVYEVPLPANASGMEASVVRIRSKTLWTRGVDVGAVHVPPGVVSKPHVRRLVIVYEDFGEQSPDYFDVPGYSLVGPVVGFQAYDASDINSIGNMELGLRVDRDPIIISFQLPEGTTSAPECACFGSNGSVSLYNMESSNLCTTKTIGHFGIVTPSAAAGNAKMGRWKGWIIACGTSGGGLVLVGLVGIGICRLRKRKMEEIERNREEGEALDNVRVGRSKMPSATMVRTQPALDNEIAI